MAGLEIVQTEEMPKVRIDNIHPVIKAFIGNVTVKQWALLKVGTPDDTTQVLLADMFMNIVTALREAFLQAFRSMDVVVSEDCVKATLGDTIPESFAEVLKVDDQVQCASSKLLSEW
ncbi:RNA polymerase sigma-B factor [Dissostichus eleginoides]|uniref:RNA polymerase sigma-B factor n=1 Tax=Dissostichus eleginoides TaxID=100907 RepID=A0AAD9BJS4_DISEL|nr:RNA polymerase sigma-B factor [Dissostichus eleginoides]